MSLIPELDNQSSSQASFYTAREPGPPAPSVFESDWEGWSGQMKAQPELTDVVLELRARPGYPIFITCGRFYLTPGQQAEASCLKDDGITATTPRPETLLRDPLEDPVPTVVEDLSSVKLAPDTTLLLLLLLQEI
jgi:hypothetical protein